MENFYTENKDRIMISPTEAAKSKDRFDRLVKLTLKILGLVTLPLEYLMHFSPWIALVMTWDQHRDKMQCNDVIYAALHYMKWSVFPTKEGLLRGTPHEKDMCELLATFQEELRSPGFGHIEILKVDRYKLCHFTVEISTRADTKPTLKSVSNCHQLFLKARFLHLTHPFDEMADEMGDCAVFKEAVESLIPNASSWDDTQWCNERYILSQINRRYHTHYLKAPIQLNGLVILAIKAKQGIAAPDIPLADIQELPIALLQQLWPQNTELVIKCLYNATYRLAKHNEQLAKRRTGKKLYPEEFGFAALKGSAIQKLAEQAIMDKMIVDKQFKTKVFDVLMKF